ncbi:cobalt-precorrin-6y C15-methyltransferase [Klebsiella pneumoniae]|nr:cobalt-precorrin-6y C15-methyltransferase [Klebsiella pneumoniae]
MKDELFLRGAQVPMTKEAVRALALAKLELHRARHLIDIGAGTGSVSIEAALQNRRCG